jgi:predicted AlkP superfamily phosphohydrolase/phosphomutase
MTDETADSELTMGEDDRMQTESDDSVPEEMTEQIEATFGPISVYVSGTNTEDVQETFDHVWETMIDTSETMKEMKASTDDDADGPTRTFG